MSHLPGCSGTSFNVCSTQLVYAPGAPIQQSVTRPISIHAPTPGPITYWCTGGESLAATVSLPEPSNPISLSDLSAKAEDMRNTQVDHGTHTASEAYVEDKIDRIQFDKCGKPILNFQSVDYINKNPCKPQYNGPLGVVPLIQSSLFKPNFPLADEEPVQYRSSSVVVTCPSPPELLQPVQCVPQSD